MRCIICDNENGELYQYENGDVVCDDCQVDYEEEILAEEVAGDTGTQRAIEYADEYCQMDEENRIILNPFVQWLFDSDKDLIETVLVNYAKENLCFDFEKDKKDYCMEERSDFVQDFMGIDCEVVDEDDFCTDDEWSESWRDFK